MLPAMLPLGPEERKKDRTDRHPESLRMDSIGQIPSGGAPLLSEIPSLVLETQRGNEIQKRGDW